MTSEEHNKFIGIAHLVYGGIQTLLFLVAALFMLGVLAFGGTEVFIDTFFIFFVCVIHCSSRYRLLSPVMPS